MVSRIGLELADFPGRKASLPSRVRNVGSLIRRVTDRGKRDIDIILVNLTGKSVETQEVVSTI